MRIPTDVPGVLNPVGARLLAIDHEIEALNAGIDGGELILQLTHRGVGSREFRGQVGLILVDLDVQGVDSIGQGCVLGNVTRFPLMNDSGGRIAQLAKSVGQGAEAGCRRAEEFEGVLNLTGRQRGDDGGVKGDLARVVKSEPEVSQALDRA